MAQLLTLMYWAGYIDQDGELCARRTRNLVIAAGLRPHLQAGRWCQSGYGIIRNSCPGLLESSVRHVGSWLSARARAPLKSQVT